MKTNLLELVAKGREEIGIYLEDVTINDFIWDVRELAKKKADKEAIKIAINKLQELL